MARAVQRCGSQAAVVVEQRSDATQRTAPTRSERSAGPTRTISRRAAANSRGAAGGPGSAPHATAGACSRITTAGRHQPLSPLRIYSLQLNVHRHENGVQQNESGVQQNFSEAHRGRRRLRERPLRLRPLAGAAAAAAGEGVEVCLHLLLQRTDPREVQLHAAAAAATVQLASGRVLGLKRARPRGGRGERPPGRRAPPHPHRRRARCLPAVRRAP